MATREEEYLRRMIALGYEPSLAGMDDEDFDYEPSWSSQNPNRLQAPELNRGYRPVDRDFAERLFRMFARPSDRNWKMPDLSGQAYAQKSQTGDQSEGVQENKIVDWDTWKKRYLPGFVYGGNLKRAGEGDGQPPFKIIVGGKELERDNNGQLVIRF